MSYTNMDSPDFATGMSLGYYLTKNKNFIHLTFPEYMLNQAVACCCHKLNIDTMAVYTSYERMKYSNDLLDRWYFGKVGYIENPLDPGFVDKITFVAHKTKNDWGFDTGNAELNLEIEVGREDIMFTWKYGFALVQFKECDYEEINTIHQFSCIPELPSVRPWGNRWLGDDGDMRNR